MLLWMLLFTFVAGKLNFTMNRIYLIAVLFACICMACASDKKADVAADKPAQPQKPSTTAVAQSNESMINSITFAEGAKPQPRQQRPKATPPKRNEPPQNAQGVWHFICPKGCTGGAGAAVPCKICGTSLMHNQAYHNTGNTGAQQRKGQVKSPIIKTQPGQNGNMTISPNFKKKG